MQIAVHLVAVFLGASSALSLPTSTYWQEAPWTIFDGGAQEQWNEKRYGMEDGLPSLQVSAVEHGPDGRLWVGTSGGVVTFDGIQFRSPDYRYVVREGSNRGLARPLESDLVGRVDSDYVTALFREGDDCIWAGTATGELRRYVGSECQIIQAGDSMTWASLLAQASDGAIWAGGRGLIRVTASDVEVICDDRATDRRFIRGLASDPESDETNGVTWVSTSEGLSRWDAPSGLVEIDTTTTHGVFFDSSHRQWRLTASTIEVGDHSVPWDVAKKSSLLFRRIHIDAERTLVVLDGESLICDFHGGAPQVVPLEDSGSSIDMTRGPNGSLWIASGTVGLRFIEGSTFTSIPVPAESSSLLTLEPTLDGFVAIASIFSPSSPGLWIARPTRSDLSGPPVVPALNRKGADEPAPNRIFDVAMESERAGWLVTELGTLRLEDGGVRLVGPEGEHRYRRGCVCLTPSGSLWTHHEHQLVELRDGTLTGRSFELEGGILTNVVAMGDDLVAFQDERVVRLSTDTMTAETILELPGLMYGTVFLQGGGDLWIPTDGRGLYRLRATGEVDQWTTEQGLAARFLGGVCTVPGPTESTHLWLNSNAGVLAITLDSLNRTARGEQELLQFHTFPTGEFLGGGSAPLPSGLVAFPTVTGPIVIDTHKPLPSIEPPSLSTAAIWADGMKLMDDGELRGYTDLEFEYCAAQFPFRRSSLVQFRLEGHDTDWHDGGQDRLARYTALPPGSYQFRLRARAGGSDFGPVVSGPALVILPFWHQRLAVRVSLLAAFLGLSLLFFRGRTRRLLRHSQALEAEIVRREEAETDLSQLRDKEVDLRRQLARAEEAERSRLARELHDDFSQRLAALSLTLQLSGEKLQPVIDPSEHQSLLEAQAGIEQLASDVHSLSRQLHPAVLDDLGLSAALRSECKMRGGRMEARLSMDDDGHCADVRGEVGLAFFRVAQEALQNASRHSGAEDISVSLRRNESNIELCIHDNGRGFEVGSTVGRGLGLSSMRERMHLVGGELTVKSDAGSGTKVCAQAQFSSE